MSKNRNRAKFNKAQTSKEYKLLMMHYEYSYCYICTKRCGSFYYDCSPQNTRVRHRHGSGKPIYTWKYRSYKTWKHSRKTKWKEQV